jgi:acetoin utilization deacetylase AcuC-like enzyme
MDTTKFIELLAYTLPALITGGVAYYFFQMHTKNEEGRRRYLLQKELQKDALPLRLQAYERMVLFLERINPTKLLIRITPISNHKNDYENYVIAQIEQEFEHNLTQQIYMSDECWTIIMTAKNATIQMIRKAAMSERVDSADKLREVILSDLMEKPTPSSAALSYMKNELKEFL